MGNITQGELTHYLHSESRFYILFEMEDFIAYRICKHYSAHTVTITADVTSPMHSVNSVHKNNDGETKYCKNRVEEQHKTKYPAKSGDFKLNHIYCLTFTYY